MIQVHSSPSCNTKVKELCEAREGSFVKDRKVGTFFGIACEEEEDESEGRIQGRLLDKASDGISR